MMRKSLKKLEHLQKEANKEIRGNKKESSEAKPMLRIQKSSKDKQQERSKLPRPPLINLKT